MTRDHRADLERIEAMERELAAAKAQLQQMRAALALLGAKPRGEMRARRRRVRVCRRLVRR